jgi:hypothetical protein
MPCSCSFSSTANGPAVASQEMSLFSCPLHSPSHLHFHTPLCGRYQSGFVGFVSMLDAAHCFHILHSAWFLVPAVYDTVGEKISSHLKPGRHLPQEIVYHKRGASVSYLCCDYVMYREEVMRAMPQYEEMKRRARKKEREAAKAAARAEEEAIGAKRQENSHLSHSKQIDIQKYR